jgi:membrane-bound ClpP family serine protease
MFTTALEILGFALLVAAAFVAFGLAAALAAAGISMLVIGYLSSADPLSKDNDE